MNIRPNRLIHTYNYILYLIINMNKNFIHPVLTTAFTLCVGISLPFLFGNARFDSQQDSVRNDVSHLTASPTVPQEISFAGQTIRFDRYDYRERMDRELLSFTYMHSTTMLSIKRANRYFPIIEPILKECGIPDDFKYLAVIESGLNHLAKSPAGAAGMWQFMQSTGRQYGLEVNQNIDERYHVEKATRAACRYLHDSYERYGNWLSVAAAYNAGQARISSQLQKQMATHAADLWLVEETSRYMFRLLAAKAVLSDPRRYGFILRSDQLYPSIACTTDTVTSGIADLASYAKRKGITYAQLKDFNPWLRSTFLQNRSGRTYVLKLPTREGMYYDPRATKPHDLNWVTR